jgi:cytochrome c oxidase subunit 4
MADEVKNPTPIDPENPPEEIKEIEDETVRELRDVPIESVPDSELPPEAQEIKHEEPSAEREARREAEAVLNKPIEAIEDTVNALDKADQAKAVEEHAMPHVVSNETLVMGRVIPLPLYTVVYITLGALTLLEVLIAQLPRGVLSTALLLIMSVIKMILVVTFYMHLRDDSRIFLLVLLVPLFIAFVASLFLVASPISGY